MYTKPGLAQGMLHQRSGHLVSPSSLDTCENAGSIINDCTGAKVQTGPTLDSAGLLVHCCSGRASCLLSGSDLLTIPTREHRSAAALTSRPSRSVARHSLFFPALTTFVTESQRIQNTCCWCLNVYQPHGPSCPACTQHPHPQASTP